MMYIEHNLRRKGESAPSSLSV